MSILGAGGGGSTINIERIDSQHFIVHMDCQSPIIDRGGGNYAAPLFPCKTWGCTGNSRYIAQAFISPWAYKCEIFHDM